MARVCTCGSAATVRRSSCRSEQLLGAGPKRAAQRIRWRSAARAGSTGPCLPRRFCRVQRAAVEAAQRTLNLSMALYVQGAADYLTVVTSQTATYPGSALATGLGGAATDGQC